jgi:hypothetical protein
MRQRRFESDPDPQSGFMWYTRSMPFKDPEKKRAYQREWYAKRRASYLEDKSCAVCGSTDRLEVDHKDPKQKLSHRVWSWTATRREAELEKCQVLCYEHHLEKTKRQAEESRQHGHTLYRHGCRCDICKQAQREHNARRYASVV